MPPVETSAPEAADGRLDDPEIGPDRESETADLDARSKAPWWGAALIAAVAAVATGFALYAFTGYT
ncbi:MAG: hypothetical protein SGJ13_16225, partial [Actinomycetota bacterium]|nr:hypothetical protein [Actinomycetota bacterium]